METTSLLSVSGIPTLEAKRIQIGNQVYLASQHSIAIRSQIIYENNYSRTTMKDGEAIHLHYEGSFNVHGKLLEVSAISKTSFGPAGDRLRLDVTYDGKVIGDYRALISYMGGGSNGQFPCIKTDEWILTFRFSSTGFNGKQNQLLIEYFKVLIPDIESSQPRIPSKRISPIDFPDGFLDEEFAIEDLSNHRVIHWMIPVIDISDKTYMGKLYYCTYPDFERYTIPALSFSDSFRDIVNSLTPGKVFYDKVQKVINNSTGRKEFIGRSRHGNFLKHFEFESEGKIQWYSLEGNTYVKRIT